MGVLPSGHRNPFVFVNNFYGSVVLETVDEAVEIRQLVDARNVHIRNSRRHSRIGGLFSSNFGHLLYQLPPFLGVFGDLFGDRFHFGAFFGLRFLVRKARLFDRGQQIDVFVDYHVHVTPDITTGRIAKNLEQLRKKPSNEKPDRHGRAGEEQTAEYGSKNKGAEGYAPDKTRQERYPHSTDAGDNYGFRVLLHYRLTFDLEG